MKERRLVLDVHLPAGPSSTMADEVRRGLATNPKTLPSKYFYDERGSELFERITELPEYYQTRTEAAILAGVAPALVGQWGFNELVELGSGSSTKTRTLLDAMEARNHPRRYIPIDLSRSMLQQSAAALLSRYPRLSIHAVVGDFQSHLAKVPERQRSRLVIFLGSTIGNLDVGERRVFLRDVRGLLDAGDAFLLGLDLVKDVARLEAAYNDSAGVTAEFNLNILRVVNRELGADFNLAAFRHWSFYNVQQQRIEMHLIPDRDQLVRLPALGLSVAIGPQETIRTEISCKFTRQSASDMIEEAGLTLAAWYTDPEELFGLALATRRP